MVDVEPFILYGRNGTKLSLPYPESFTGEVILREILKDFPGVLVSFPALYHLINYPHCTIGDKDVTRVLTEAPADVLQRLLEDNKFNELRLTSSPKAFPDTQSVMDIFSLINESLRRPL